MASNPATTVDRLHLVGSPGSGIVMNAELTRLCKRALSDYRGPKPRKLGSGAVALPFDPRVAAVARRYHRTSSRLLWDLYVSRAARLEPLYEELLSAVQSDSRDWTGGARTLSIRARNVHSFPAGSRQLVGAVKNALIDGLGARGQTLEVDADEPDLELSIRRHDDSLIVSVDIGGGARHARGYRLEAGKAPLRESLAATLLMLARWNPRAEHLIDPMAGSGTIAIEAALMARAEPLSLGPARWPVIAQADIFGEPLFADAHARVTAIEIDSTVASTAERNAARAGVEIDIVCADFRAAAPPAVTGGALVLSNPPYGRRLKAAAELPEQLATWAGSHRYRVGVLTEDRSFRHSFLTAYPGSFVSDKPLPNASARTHFLLFACD